MPRRIQARLLIHALGLVLIDEAVGQMQRADFQAGVQQSVLGKKLQQMRAEAAARALLDGNQHLMMARKLPDEIVIQRLGKTRIRDGRRKAARGKLVRRVQAFAEPSAE